MPAKQMGKKHGKRNVNPGDGFVSVAYESGRAQSVSMFTNRKDVGDRRA